jgi:2-polyprenyl-6-methoxyphenol hydroxylase-like FAD-dependent oxidoreductase
VGAGRDNDNWRAASPWRQLNLPQIRLEPILKAGAKTLSPGRVRFNHELRELQQDPDGVQALVRDNGTGEEYIVHCRYLLGADGGRSCARKIGVRYEGLGVLTQTATLHVTADFSRWADDPDVLIRWIASPQAGALIVMVPMGPERWGPDSEEWVIHLNSPAADLRAQSDEQVEADVRAAIGLPDAPMTIHKITRWSVDAVMASASAAAGSSRWETPLIATRRPGAWSHERDPRRAEPVLEARRRAGGGGVSRAARHVRAGATRRRRAQRPAVARERRQPARDRQCTRCSS